MSDTYRIKLACEKCDRSMLLTVALPGSTIHSFECPCGHITQMRQIPARMTDRAQLLASAKAGAAYDHSPSRIVCAANRHKDGRIVIGPRHFDSTMIAALMAQPDWDTDGWKGSEQGFIDQHGDFFTREQAWAIAKPLGQCVRSIGMPDNGVLYSEHLY